MTDLENMKPLFLIVTILVIVVVFLINEFREKSYLYQNGYEFMMDLYREKKDMSQVELLYQISCESEFFCDFDRGIIAAYKDIKEKLHGK